MRCDLRASNSNSLGFRREILEERIRVFFFHVVGLAFMGKLIEGEVSEELHSKDADLLWKVRLFNYLAYESVAFVSLLTKQCNLVLFLKNPWGVLRWWK